MRLHTISEIRDELCKLRDEIGPEGDAAGRTSVLTLVAWVPPGWRQETDDALEGLMDAHPSRVIVVMAPSDGDAELLEQGHWPFSASVRLRALEGSSGRVAAEVITIELTAVSAGVASMVLPLVRSDLPVFLRWRGPLPEGKEPLASLLDVADRLIVDAREWPDIASGYAKLRTMFEHVASSDICWQRLEPWRRAIAAHGLNAEPPAVVEVHGPDFEARLLAAWLVARLGSRVALEHCESVDVVRVRLDGEDVRVPRHLRRSDSELLSCELDQLGRDPIYEEAACALSSVKI